MADPLEMSLDDYINSFQEVGNCKMNGSEHVQESPFKEGRRDQAENEDDVGDTVAQTAGSEYVSLAFKNDELALMRVDPNDLRNKIGGRCPSSTSQQWRLMQPNVIHARPPGMPPLIPTNISENIVSGNNWKNYNGKYRNTFGRQNWRNNKNRRYGRIQRFGDNNRANWSCKNIKTVLEQLKERNPMILYSELGTPDLTVEASIQEQDKSFIFKPFEVQTINKQSNVKTGFEEVHAKEKSGHSDAMKSLLGVNEVVLSNDMMPMLAGKLLDFINGVNPVVHKPQYDMRIQKEIHEIQKKPLLYKCPGGEVVSADGAGIPNCKIQPKASGVSLNHRFA